MSFHVKDDFKAGMPISGVGVDWFNKVGGFLNALAGGLGMKLFKPSKPSASNPITISIEPKRLKEILIEPVTEPDQTVSLNSGMELNQTNLAVRKGDTFKAGTYDGKGLKCYLCFRGAVDGTGNAALYWREVTITNDGRIQSIAAEAKVALQVYHSTE